VEITRGRVHKVHSAPKDPLIFQLHPGDLQLRPVTIADLEVCSASEIVADRPMNGCGQVGAIPRIQAVRYDVNLVRRNVLVDGNSFLHARFAVDLRIICHFYILLLKEKVQESLSEESQYQESNIKRHQFDQEFFVTFCHDVHNISGTESQ